MRKEGMIAHVTALHEYFNRSTRSLTEDDSAFAPPTGDVHRSAASGARSPDR